MSKNKYYIVLIIIPFFIYKFYEKKAGEGIKLSEAWSLVSDSEEESGFDLFDNQPKDSNNNFVSMRCDEIFIDKKNEIAIIKNLPPNGCIYYYQMFYLDKYGLIDLNRNDSLKINNKIVCVKDIKFIAPWRVVFNSIFLSTLSEL